MTCALRICPQRAVPPGMATHYLPHMHTYTHIHTRAHTGTCYYCSRETVYTLLGLKKCWFSVLLSRATHVLKQGERVQSVGGWMNTRDQLFPGPCTPHFCPRRLPSLQWTQAFGLAGMVCSCTAALDRLGRDAGLWEADGQG